MYDIEKITLLLFLCGSVLYDLKSGRIPNLLIGTGICCAFAGRTVRAVQEILPAVKDHQLIGRYEQIRSFTMILAMGAAGMLLPIVLLYFLFYFRMIGAGDIKLLCMCGAFLGPQDAFSCIIISFLAGGVISVILLLKHGNIHSRFLCFFQYLADTRYLRHRKSYLAGVSRDGRFCFSLPVLISAALKVGGVY